MHNLWNKEQYIAIYEIFLCLLAPVRASVPVDVKSEAATGKMFNTEYRFD